MTNSTIEEKLKLTLSKTLGISMKDAQEIVSLLDELVKDIKESRSK